MYGGRRQHGRGQPGRPAGGVDPGRPASPACRSGLQLIAPAFAEARLLAAGASLPANAHRLASRSRHRRARRMTQWQAVIGLEIHAQLNDAQQAVLGRVGGLRRRAEHAGLLRSTPACPARLPVAERRGGAARRCTLGLADGRRGSRRVSMFARKNYFYPDLTQGLPDFSQFERPVVAGGSVAVHVWRTAAN
jgi:hypothetical protein